MSRQSLLEILSEEDQWKRLIPGDWHVVLLRCEKCNGSTTIQGPRCVLDLDHADACSSEMAVVEVEEFMVEVPG
jgi:hypothetical protein